ncbi:MAG: hypothetical protein IKY41_01615 [Clostridia bacterium]|nr:hypothetical protein [Clostridia bacterium]
MKQKEGIGEIVSSSPWSIASVKKSILFDVLGVMDRANRIRTRRTLQFDYSLLKKETAEKYEELYKVARNRSEWFAAAFYVPNKKHGEERETVMFSFLIEKAFDWVSYNCLERWLKETGSEAIVYYIAAACLSNEENAISPEDVSQMARGDGGKIIDALNKTDLPEKVKMSVYTIVYNHETFLKKFLNYLKNVYEAVFDLYTQYAHVCKNTNDALVKHLKSNSEYSLMLWEIKERIHDEKKRKHVIVLSLVRLEWGWMKHAKSAFYYIKGLFAIQRIINDDGFCIF